MNYYLDTEFHEYKKQVNFLGFELAKIDTIELISIGLVCEDGREYYAVSKDFDIEAAWNNQWLKNNVLKDIWEGLSKQEGTYTKTYHPSLIEWSKKGLKNLIKWHGKTNKEIKQDIILFVCSYSKASEYAGVESIDKGMEYYLRENKPKFYGYYADYDWVVFCWLFGRMIDLPAGFPMFCNDLKQMLVEAGNPDINHLKNGKEHNALSDAYFNKDVHLLLTNAKTPQN